MTDQRGVAIVQASVARAIIRALGMHATNMQRQAIGASMAYDEAAFLGVIESEAIGWNQVIELLNG